MTSETPPVCLPPVVNTKILSVEQWAVMRVEWTGLNAKRECTVTLHALWASELELKPMAFSVGFDRPTTVDITAWEPDAGHRTAQFQLRSTPGPEHLAFLWANVPLDRSDFFSGRVGDIVQIPHHAPTPAPKPRPPVPSPKPPPRSGGIPWSKLPPTGSAPDHDLDEA